MINNGIKLFDVKWTVETAGPSPCNNERTEVFFFGCKKAMSGNPCKGCFNSITWDDSIVEKTHDPVEMAAHINAYAPNKYITIGGGEPTDQIENLIILCRELKKYGFHIMMYTWRSLRDYFKAPGVAMIMDSEFAYMRDNLRKLIMKGCIDIIVDGQYVPEEHQYDETKGDGLCNSIGSGNQMVWDVRHYHYQPWPMINCVPFVEGYAMRDIAGLYVKPENNNLVYILKENSQEIHLPIV
jgi:hypothetical protein